MSPLVARDKRDQEGWWARYRYWKPFEAHAVDYLLKPVEFDRLAHTLRGLVPH